MPITSRLPPSRPAVTLPESAPKPMRPAMDRAGDFRKRSDGPGFRRQLQLGGGSPSAPRPVKAVRTSRENRQGDLGGPGRSLTRDSVEPHPAAEP